jgi:hypothetical protein
MKGFPQKTHRRDVSLGSMNSPHAWDYAQFVAPLNLSIPVAQPYIRPGMIIRSKAESSKHCSLFLRSISLGFGRGVHWRPLPCARQRR